ncbi:hypothetical protein Taro_025094 [Colocasia esculenta]|uniref:General transcription and DNA repair factor IIH subunit TFB5 n=1 Tax=Colocasia esculenta TaxID=4460 RepID=A0A843VJH3_COLES|nr:hypothetical protein [Colocasia esculenta]
MYQRGRRLGKVEDAVGRAELQKNVVVVGILSVLGRFLLRDSGFWRCAISYLRPVKSRLQCYFAPISLRINQFCCCMQKMVNAIKGLFISCDIPMAQFIINMNASLPASQRFILHILDDTHMFVQPHFGEMIKSRISEFRDQNTYEKPA